MGVNEKVVTEGGSRTATSSSGWLSPVRSPRCTREVEVPWGDSGDAKGAAVVGTDTPHADSSMVTATGCCMVDRGEARVQYDCT